MLWPEKNNLKIGKTGTIGEPDKVVFRASRLKVGRVGPAKAGSSPTLKMKQLQGLNLVGVFYLHTFLTQLID